jgi:outer membrane usher protein FimD/PapC
MSSTTVDSNLGGSIAVLHDSGVNAAFSYGTEKMQAVGRNTKKNLFGLIGYNAKIFGVGGTGFAVTYARTKNNAANDDEGTAWGLQATQAFSKIGASLSLVYRNYDFENSTTAQTNIDSIDVFGLQAAFAF